MRTVLLALIGAVHLIIGSSALASEVPKFEQVEDWVKVADIEEVLANSSDSEAVFVLLDRQTQLVPGMVSNYADIAFRIGSTKTMSEMVPVLSPSWHPDHGDLIIHRFEIIRGSDVIDLTSNENLFQVIRREKNLERQMINGNLTALSQVEDVQLNDVVRISFTITKRNEALGDRVQTLGQFIDESVNIDFMRQTVRWPEKMKVKWRTSKKDAAPTETVDAGWRTLAFDYRCKELDVEIPKNAPMRFKDRNTYEIGSFASWQDVSKVNARLYPADDGLVAGGELDQEIQAIARKTSDKKERMALALQLVQDKVRYLFNGLGFGNYTPQSPEETWRLRYGDCKAKTYLLLAVLRRLDIDAVPMLVSTSQRDAVADRLPSFQVFNHIIVKAEVGGVNYWLDGTSNGTVAADMGDAPAHRYGLPSIAGGADLEEIPIRRPGRPFQAVNVTYDLTAGTDLPALFDLKAELRDSDAQNLKTAAAQLSAEKMKELREEVALRYVVSGLISESTFTYDENLETGYVTAKGLSYLQWDTKSGQREHSIWSQASSFDVQKSRNEEELRDLPVRLNYPKYFKYQIAYILPERYKDAVIEGNAKVDGDFAGSRFERSVERQGNRVISDEAYYTARWELPADQFELERRKLALLKRAKVKIALPVDAPRPWEELPGLESSSQLQGHKEAFDARVANAKADDTAELLNRAYFYELRGDYLSAIADLKRASEIETNPEIYKWMASLQEGTDPAAAKANYNKAIAIKPAFFEAVLSLIRLHIIAGDFTEANAVLERAKTNGMRETSVASVQIELLQAKGKFGEALQIMDALVDEDPDDASYLADRCLLRAMEGKQLDIALDDCTNMIELAERSVYYHFIRGLVYYRKGEYEAAIADLDKSIRTEAGTSYAYFLRAAANRKLGKAEAAKSDEAAAEYYYKFDGLYWTRFIN